MLDDLTTRRICDAVDHGFDAQLQFTRQLVAQPSQRGQERAAQEFIGQALRERGLSVDCWAIDIEEIRGHAGFSPVTVSYADAINVVGTHRPRERQGRSLILNGHVDVVPTGPLEMWTHPPYEARVVDGWLHGRGAGDMKAGLAANIFAFDALRAVGLEPAAPVHLQSVVEEECTGNGALACLTRGYHADAALITEPVNDGLVRANVGVLWFQVEVRGRPAHVFESQKGTNAIVSTYPVIQALQRLETDWNAKKGTRPHFAGTEKPITINVGKIEGGDWASSVPCWCRIDVRAGIYPGTSVADAQAEIEGAVREACRDDPFLSKHPASVTYNGFTAEGYVLEEGSDAEACLRRAHGRVFSSELRAEVSPAYLDARVFVLYADTPALVYGPVCERIHGFDERVELESVRRVTQTIALFMADWCGVAPLP